MVETFYPWINPKPRLTFHARAVLTCSIVDFLACTKLGLAVRQYAGLDHKKNLFQKT